MPINQIIKTFFNSFIISSLIISLCYPLSVYPCDFTAKDEPKGFTDLSSKEKVNVSQEWKPFEREEFGDEEDFEDEDFEDDEYGEDEKVALKKLKKHIKPIKILRGSTQQDPVSKSGDKKTGQTKVSDPVVIPTGNYFESVTDLPANRTDTALLFKRYYNSLNSVEKGSFGYGWSHRYDIRLEEKEKGAIVHMGTGESHYYKKDGKKYVAPKGVYNDLVRGRKGNVYLITPDRVTYVFDSSYHRNVTYIKDLNGVLFTMKYNNITQKLVKVTDRYGDWIKFSYDFNGKIKEIKDSAGRKVKYVCNYTDDILLEVQGVTGGIVQYKYDRNKNMVEKTYSDGVKLIMRYDEKNRVIEQGNEQDRLMYRFVYDDQKKIVTFYERAVKRTQSYYNDDNKIVKEIDALGGVIDRKYDKEGNVACVLDKNGGEYSYRYNARGDLIMMVDPLGNVTRYRYDRRSNKLIVVENALGVTTEMLRDKQGNIRKIIEGDGAVTVFKNDRYGMPVMITDPVGKKTQINYDSRGYIKSVKKMGDDVGQGIVRYYKRDGLGNVILYTDPNGNKTKYWYDARLNLRKIIRKTNNGKDAVIKMEYDQFDNVVSMKDARRNITRYTYTKDWWNKLAAVINTDGVKTRYIYDMYGKLLKYVNGKGAVTKYTYDDLGEMIKMTDPLGFSQTYAYDQGGNLIEVVNGKGVALWYSYDPLGRMIKATDGNGNAVEMKYDALSNLLMVKDPKGGEVFYRYDVLNRLIKQRDQLDNEKVYSYDKAGSLLFIVNANGDKTLFDYGPYGRMVKKVIADKSDIGYRYDKNGNLVNIGSGKQNISMEYDGFNRIVSVDNGGKRISYEYDLNGNKVATLLGKDVLYRYRYDKLNRVEEIVYGNDAVTYQHDAVGMRTKRSLSNGIVTSYTYDANNNMTMLEAKNAGGDVLNRYEYQYDKVGNRKTMTTISGTVTYTYDNNSQLIVADYSDETSERYEYDVNGNRVRLVKTGTEGDTKESYSYNAANQLISKETQTDGNSKVDTSSYEYDEIGNLVQEVSPDREIMYEYNADNKLSKMISGKDDIASFSYDLFGRRIVKKEWGYETRYIYDGLNRIAETDSQGEIKKRFIFGVGIDEVIAVKNVIGNVKEYFSHDGLGSVTASLDDSGKVTKRYTYSSFGSPVEEPKYYGFTGREYDASSGLYYYRARYYNPELGRFTQQDPLGMPDGINRYIYCMNNPVNWVDPLGLDREDRKSGEEEGWLENIEWETVNGGVRGAKKGFGQIIGGLVITQGDSVIPGPMDIIGGVIIAKGTCDVISSSVTIIQGLAGISESEATKPSIVGVLTDENGWGTSTPAKAGKVIDHISQSIAKEFSK